MKPKDKNSWGTPKWLFDSLNAKYHFELDAAADSDNHLCNNYFNKDQDALSQDWSAYGSVWCNPPYSAKSKANNSHGILAWCEKCYEEHCKNYRNHVVVMLIPSDTSTQYFRYCFTKAASINFITPRIKFIGATGSPKFGSMVVVFDRSDTDCATINLITVTEGNKLRIW